MISGKKNEDSESGQETACGDLDEEEAGTHREQFSRECWTAGIIIPQL